MCMSGYKRFQNRNVPKRGETAHFGTILIHFVGGGRWSRPRTFWYVSILPLVRLRPPAGLESLGRRAGADDAPALAHERAGLEGLLERLHHLWTAQGRDGHASRGPARPISTCFVGKVPQLVPQTAGNGDETLRNATVRHVSGPAFVSHISEHFSHTPRSTVLVRCESLR